MASSAPTSALSVKINSGERAILEAAAEGSHTDLGDFVRRKALEAAEIEVLNRSVVVVPADDWERFETWARLPAGRIPALDELAHLTPTWER